MTLATVKALGLGLHLHHLRVLRLGVGLHVLGSQGHLLGLHLVRLLHDRRLVLTALEISILNLDVGQLI